jgi:hypothetical protein
MKNNFSQSIAKLDLPLKMFVALITGSLMLLLSYSTGFAPTKLTDSELSDIDSQAIFRITHYTGSAAIPFGTYPAYQTGSTDTIRLELGLDMEMSAYIRSFKLGYYDGGWDQDVTNYYWGRRTSSGPVLTEPLRWTGLFLDFGFDNLADNATKVLNYIEVGTPSATGQVTGTLNQVNTLALTGTGSNQGLALRATGAGTRRIQFSNSPMSFVFATKYSYTSRSHTGTTHTGLSGIFIKVPEYNLNHISGPE